ncbi:MAG TPA: hypothetical protein VL492_02055 [Methylovirgula sp.]|nr:hypothetical protein [Methylovirgula sp.]
MSMADDNKDQKGIVLTPQQLKSRKQRNVAIGLAVGFFVVLFYVVTIAKLGPGVMRSPM